MGPFKEIAGSVHSVGVYKTNTYYTVMLQNSAESDYRSSAQSRLEFTAFVVLALMKSAFM